MPGTTGDFSSDGLYTGIRADNTVRPDNGDDRRIQKYTDFNSGGIGHTTLFRHDKDRVHSLLKFGEHSSRLVMFAVNGILVAVNDWVDNRN